MSCSRLASCCLLLIAGAISSASPTVFLATDGARLYRADSTGATFGFITMSAEIQSLTILPTGVNLAGASAGDIIACARNATGGRYNLYRLDNPTTSGTLVQIGSVDQGVGSLAFANGEMFGVEDSVSPLRIMKFNIATGNTITNYNTGVAEAGGGGLVFNSSDNNFYFTADDSNRLYKWTPGGAATIVGPTGLGFSNNGMEYHDGALYGALRRDTPSNQMNLGYFNQATGAFTTQATLTGILGNGTGFVAVPEPGLLSCMGMGIFALVARKRKR